MSVIIFKPEEHPLLQQCWDYVFSLGINRKTIVTLHLIDYDYQEGKPANYEIVVEVEHRPPAILKTFRGFQQWMRISFPEEHNNVKINQDRNKKLKRILGGEDEPLV
jgi:hypothetical protein